MITLDVPSSLESVKAKATAVAGSGVTPQERFVKDRSGYKREYQKKLYDDSQKNIVAAKAKDNGRPRDQLDACIGMSMHSDTFMRRLIQLNSSLWFEEANADKDKIGVYLLVPVSMTFIEGKQFLFGFHKGVMPEFTLQKHAGDDGENVGILRQGWRTILARLIRMRMISFEKVEVMFGQPSHQSAYWAVLTGKRSELE